MSGLSLCEEFNGENGCCGDPTEEEYVPARKLPHTNSRAFLYTVHCSACFFSPLSPHSLLTHHFSLVSSSSPSPPYYHSRILARIRVRFDEAAETMYPAVSIGSLQLSDGVVIS